MGGIDDLSYYGIMTQIRKKPTLAETSSQRCIATNLADYHLVSPQTSSQQRWDDRPESSSQVQGAASPSEG